MESKRGYVLIEVLVGIGIFVLSISGALYWMLDSIEIRRLAEERALAHSLAVEGIEATKTIRDSSNGFLNTGNHGLLLSGGVWTFSGTSDATGQFTRVVIVTAAGSGRYDLISRITWPFSAQRNEAVEIRTRVAFWRR